MKKGRVQTGSEHWLGPVFYDSRGSEISLFFGLK